MKHFAKHLIFFLIPAFTALLFLQVSPASCKENQNILVVLCPFKRAVLSAEVSSTINKIHHEMGERFKKNTPLIDFNSSVYAADREKADALLLSAEAVYKTNSKLYQQRSVSNIDFAKAKADRKIAKVNVAIAERKLKSCSACAPYDGRVVRVLVNENELVQQGQPLIEIVDDRILRAKFLVPSSLYGQIQTGQVLNVKIREIDMACECKITHISAVIESNTSTFQVFAEIDNSGNILRGGMTGEIVLKLSKGK